jgi:hypothetical protein
MWVRTMGPGKGPGEGAPRYPGGCLVSDTPVVDQIDNHRSDWGLIRSILFTTRSREGRTPAGGEAAPCGRRAERGRGA